MSSPRYEVLSKIAEGGLGAVYKAHDRNLRREVALKRVRADSPEEADRQAEQLFEEARTLSTLQHPHIVTIFDVGRDDEGAFIVMELLKGETVEDIISRGALAETDFRELVTQSLEGMIAAHSNGLIHLDIKPQNFMVIWLPSGKFQIKILDFGLSKISHTPVVQETDETGSILGSIYFMAPEQFERSPVDTRTDLYSLGCVFYYALTQHYPFQGDTAPEVMASHLYHSFIPISQLRPDLPHFIHAWVEWLMKRDPNERPASATAALETFRAGKFSGGKGGPPPPDIILTAVPVPDISHPVGDYPTGTASQPLRPGIKRPTAQRPNATQRLGSRPVPKPLAKPVNILAAAAPAHLKPRKALPKWLVVGVPLTLVALVAGWFAFDFIMKSQRISRMDSLAAAEAPTGTPKDVAILLDLIDSPQHGAKAATVLGKLQGVESAEPTIAARLRSAKTPQAVSNLANAVAQRRMGIAVEPLLTQLNTLKDEKARIDVWEALARTATVSDLATMLSRMTSSSTEELRPAENAVIQAARTDTDPDRRSEAVLQAFRANSGSEDVRAAFIRVLGRLGSSQALPEIVSALKSNDAKLRAAAAATLGDWPTAEPILALEEFIVTEKDAYIRTNAISSLEKLAPLSGSIPQDEIAQALIDAYQKARESREQLALLNALSKVVSPASLEFFTTLPQREPRRSQIANAAQKEISAAMEKSTEITDNATLLASKAVLPPTLILQENVITNWSDPSDRVNWLLKIEQPGEYEVQISQAHNGPEAGVYTLTLGSERFQRNVDKTSSNTDFRSVTLGRAKFTKPGFYRLWIRPQTIPQGSALMRLREARVSRTGS